MILDRVDDIFYALSWNDDLTSWHLSRSTSSWWRRRQWCIVADLLVHQLIQETQDSWSSVLLLEKRQDADKFKCRLWLEFEDEWDMSSRFAWLYWRWSFRILKRSWRRWIEIERKELTKWNLLNYGENE